MKISLNEKELKELKEFCYNQFENEDLLSDPEVYFDYKGISICNIFLSENTMEEFDTLEDCIDYYGEENINEFLVDYLKSKKYNNYTVLKKSRK